MTAEWSKIPFEVLEKVSNRIVNEVEHVNRVVYDITGKPPATIECRKMKSASFRIVNLSSVISPITRIASPGPGNG